MFRAGLAFVLPPARDESGLANLPSLGEVGFTKSRFESLLSVALGENPTAAELQSGDVFNPENPSGERTLTNETCLRSLESWKLTHLQVLPYERLIPGSYTAVAQLEAELGKRLVAPLVFRGTFQPWCVSRKTPSRLQVFVLEQALQVEWRVLDFTAARQALLEKELFSALKNPSRATLNGLAAAFETSERATLREQVLGDLETLVTAWQASLRPEERQGALSPLTQLFRKATQAGFGHRASLADAPRFVHPGFAASSAHLSGLRSFLKTYARNSNLNRIYTSLSESLRAPVYAVVSFEGERAQPLSMETKQALRLPAPVEGPAELTVRSLLNLGRFASAQSTHHTVAFDSSDALARKAFDAVDMEPGLLRNLPVSETENVRGRLKDVNGIHKSTTQCVYCHTWGGGRLLSGHTEAEGPQVSALTLARASADAVALLKELDARAAGSLDKQQQRP